MNTVSKIYQTLVHFSLFIKSSKLVHLSKVKQLTKEQKIKEKEDPRFRIKNAGEYSATSERSFKRIKKEDFVGSNYSPLLNIAVGKWFAPSIALQLGYKGWYFNTISDEEKHREFSRFH